MPWIAGQQLPAALKWLVGAASSEFFVRSAVHGQSATSPVVRITHRLQPADAVHAHEATTVLLTTLLVPESGAHGHVATSPPVVITHKLVPADSTHEQSASSPGIVLFLQPDDTIHGHVATSPASMLSPDSATHPHDASSPALTQTHRLSVEDSTVGQTASSPSLLQQHLLSPDSTAHWVYSPLVNVDIHAVDSTTHEVSSTSPGIVQTHRLDVHDALHGHTATTSFPPSLSTLTNEFWVRARYAHQGQEAPDQPDNSWAYPSYATGGFGPDGWGGLIPEGSWIPVTYDPVTDTESIMVPMADVFSTRMLFEDHHDWGLYEPEGWVRYDSGPPTMSVTSHGDETTYTVGRSYPPYGPSLPSFVTTDCVATTWSSLTYYWFGGGIGEPVAYWIGGVGGDPGGPELPVGYGYNFVFMESAPPYPLEFRGAKVTLNGPSYPGGYELVGDYYWNYTYRSVTLPGHTLSLYVSLTPNYRYSGYTDEFAQVTCSLRVNRRKL